MRAQYLSAHLRNTVHYDNMLWTIFLMDIIQKNHGPLEVTHIQTSVFLFMLS